MVEDSASLLPNGTTGARVRSLAFVSSEVVCHIVIFPNPTPFASGCSPLQPLSSVLFPRTLEVEEAEVKTLEGFKRQPFSVKATPYLLKA